MILITLNSVAALTCIYTLISKRYKTKSKDITMIFICLQLIFLSNLWVCIDPEFIRTFNFVFTNYLSMSLLIFCISKVKNDIDHIENNNIIDKFKNIIKRIIKVFQ